MGPVALFLMAAESIAAHKLRSSLVTLGILIGVTAVLANACMVEGFQDYFEQQMQALGSNFVTIRPATSIGLLGPQLEEGDLLERYLFDSVRRLPHVDYATASRTSYGTINYAGQEEDVVVIGAEPGYLEARNREMLLGEPLSPQDRFNAVVGHSVMSSAARRPALMSRFHLTITVDGTEVTNDFRVKGMVKDPEPGFGIGLIYIPIRTLDNMLGDEGYTDISLFAANTDDIDLVEEEAREMLDRVLRVPPETALGTTEEAAQFFGIPLPLAEEERGDYSITSQADVLSISKEISGMIQLALVAIAGISLLVGGIGIANVMLVTVAERTREIGVMKAVGAKNRQILLAFLFEAAVIGMLGGILGLVIAAAAAYTLIPLLFEVPGTLPIEWAAVAIGISLTISLLSGLYPAVRASAMEPVDALRTE